MKKHYFLGTAAGWTKEERAAQRKVTGTQEDVAKLCEFLNKHYGGEQAVITRNGRSALAMALDYGLKERGERNSKALSSDKYGSGVPGSNKSKQASAQNQDSAPEVIVNGFTCRAVVQAVKAAKCRPVYADIDPKTLNFTPESLKKVLSAKTRAIVVQNTLGNMVEIAEVEKFAAKHKLLLIEDLAHSAGRFYEDGREAGTVGEVTVLSFGKEKAIDVVNGGAVIFKKMQQLLPAPLGQPSVKEEIRARAYPTFGAIYRGLSYVGLHGVLMRLLLKWGWVEKSAEGEVDYKKKALSDFQAKLALAKFKKLKDKPIREFYLVKDRQEVLKRLKKAGYYFDGLWYEKPVAPERYYKGANFPENECPNAVFVAQHIINFPVYYSASDLKQAREIIKPFLIEQGES